MIYTEDYVMGMHDDQIKDDPDAAPGLRFGASDLYFILERINYEQDAIVKAAFALFLANVHVFNDGNKRTAYILADTILREEGECYINENDDEIIRFMRRVATLKIPDEISKDKLIEEILGWVGQRVCKRE